MSKGIIRTILTMLVLAGASFGVNVTVTTPATNTTLTSPATIKASATSTHPITGWRIYVDNVSIYQAGSVSSIAPAVNMTTGTHQVIVRAWDSSGAYGSAYLTLTVGPATTAPPASTTGVTVTLTSPTGTSATSPVTIAANATAPVSITGWHIYVDNVSIFSGGATTAISTALTMTAGTHSVIVRAWDSAGAYGSANFSLTVASGTTIIPPPTSGPHHIFVIAEENTSYGSVVGNTSQMPYFNSLLSKGTLWGNYYANAHGSMLAYIETLSGQTFNCTGNDCGASGALTGASLMSVMNANGLTWKGYFDGLSSCGQLAPQSTNWIISPDSNGAENYYQRHTGFPWYAVGTATTSTCRNGGSSWWPVSQLATDLANASVGSFNWITPDGMHDGHDGTATQLDAWMSTVLPQVLNSRYFQPGGDGVLIIWWDEADLSNSACGGPGGTACGGQIPVLVIGPGIRANNVDDTSADHDSTLRFIQEQLGLTPSLGKSVNVPDMANTLVP